MTTVRGQRVLPTARQCKCRPQSATEHRPSSPSTPNSSRSPSAHGTSIGLWREHKFYSTTVVGARFWEVDMCRYERYCGRSVIQANCTAPQHR